MTTIYEWDSEDKNIDYYYRKREHKNICLEIGCGNGLFLSTIAQQNPKMIYVGIDRRIKSIHKSQKKIEKLNLQNIILIHGDFFTSIDKYFEKNIFKIIYINFPDPWRKKRHQKKRAIQPSTLQLYYSLLKEQGSLYFVTDVFEYMNDGVTDIINSKLFLPQIKKPYYSQSLNNYPQSLYEIKARDQNKNIYYSHFIKKSITS